MKKKLLFLFLIFFNFESKSKFDLLKNNKRLIAEIIGILSLGRLIYTYNVNTNLLKNKEIELNLKNKNIELIKKLQNENIELIKKLQNENFELIKKLQNENFELIKKNNIFELDNNNLRNNVIIILQKQQNTSAQLANKNKIKNFNIPNEESISEFDSLSDFENKSFKNESPKSDILIKKNL